MKKNDVVRLENSLIRVLDIVDDKYLVIDCRSRNMCFWMNQKEFDSGVVIGEDELLEELIVKLKKFDELDNIEKKISKLKVGDEFSLSDLFEKADWDSKESYKKILGKLFKARASKLKYISITDKKKGSSAVYKKTK